MTNSMRHYRQLLLGLLAVLVCSCSNEATHEQQSSAPKLVRDKNTIVFVTLNSPSTYYVNSDKEFAGLEYDLAKAFSAFVGGEKKIKFLVADSIEEVIATIISGEADIAASDLTITAARKRLINFSTPYEEVQQQVVYNKTYTPRPARSIKGLIDTMTVVPSSSSFVERLRQYQKKLPELTWTARDDIHSEGLIEELAEGKIEYTVADSHLVSVLNTYHPDIRVAFPLGKPEKIAWGFSKTTDTKLLLEANAFFSHIKHDGTLRQLIDRYHGHSSRLKPVDINAFIARSKSRLPEYTDLFKEAQETTGLDWRLLASLSYQESHWDPNSTSPTNVRGLMMLTESTSERMGVTDRLDPEQSIFAGAKYFNLMLNTVPDHVPEPDRTYMALASYNIGYAHVEDARVLAQRIGLNPDSWVDVRKALLKLNKPKYYARAKFGYCRCAQPIIYVESIRSYYDILTRIEPAHEPVSDEIDQLASLATKQKLLTDHPYKVAAL